MDYREILRNQLQRRQEVNSKYSLRAFALRLEISPSKISEILSGKKRLSVDRAEVIANKLGLSPQEKELFVLSAQLETASKKTDKHELAKQVRALALQINARRTSQRNAWYFGAIKTLEDAGFEASSVKDQLGLAVLQIENAKRFMKRIERFYPDRKEISLEPYSILKKVEENHYANPEAGLDADFLYLSNEQAQELRKKIKILIQTYKLKTKSDSAQKLNLVHWGIFNLIS